MEAGKFKPTIKGKAKVKFIEDVWKDVFDKGITLSNLRCHRGGVRFDEMVLLASIAKHLNPKKIFEIGTCLGRTTINLAANAEDLEVLHTLNLQDNSSSDKKSWFAQDLKLYQKTKNEIGILFKKPPYDDKIFQLWGDSRNFDFSRYKDIDMVFIDANKKYEYVYSDSSNAFNIISEKGVIVWHDYNYADEVTTAVDSFARDKNLSIYNIYKTTLAVYINSE